MDPWIEQQLRQVRTVPPTCLSGFQCDPATDPSSQHHVEWKLRCPCGSDRGAVLGYPLEQFNPDYTGKPMFVSPLSFVCAACGTTIPMLDTAEHGYDAECAKHGNFSHRDCHYHGSGPPSIYHCPNCDGEEFSLGVICGHNNFDHIEDEPELEPRAQDFFDSFNCHGVCTTCGDGADIGTFKLG